MNKCYKVLKVVYFLHKSTSKFLRRRKTKMELIIILVIILVLAIIGSIAGWLNTRTILKELADIKRELGVKDVRKPSIFDNDLDKD